MILGIQEIFDVALMTFAIGFIFSDVFARFKHLHTAYPVYRPGLDWESLKFSMLVTAPAVVFHELGHKIAGMMFGLSPVVHASYWGLGLGLILKMARFPFIFFVPGYADICPGAGSAACAAFLDANPLANAFIAFGGPLVNLILWLGSSIIIKKRLMDRKYLPALFVTKQINMFLFIMNMIPLWFFDGATVFGGLIKYIITLF